MAHFQIFTKIKDGRKLAICDDDISSYEDLEHCTIVKTKDGEEYEVRQYIDDVFEDPAPVKRVRDKKTPFIPIRLSSN